MKRLICGLKDMKIQKKLVGTYIIVVLVPILMVGIILTGGMKNMAIEQAMREADINTDRFQSRFSEILNNITDVSDRLYINPRLIDILTRDYESTWEIVKAYYSFDTFDEFLRSYREIDNIKVYAYNSNIIDNWEFKLVTPDITALTWYKDAVEMDGKVLWQYIYDERTNEDNLCLTRLIKDQYGTKLGMLVIVVSRCYLNSIISGEPFETIIVMGDGTVISSKNPSLLGKKIATEGLDIIPERSYSGIKEIKYHGKPSKVITNAFIPSKSCNVFNIFTIVPIDAVTKKANKISILGFNIMGLSFMVSLVLLVFFSRMFSARIIKLKEAMHKAVQGDFELSTRIEGRDEIGELYSDLHAMIKDIKQLIYEIYEERLLKEQMTNKQKEIEFKMLASQINPHFLYNSLETIRMKAYSSGEREIADVVKMLARIMRRNLEASGKPVALESEIEMISDYLFLQRFRYEDKVSYDISVKTDIAGYHILPLLLQPIVENAFIHGLETKRGHGIIKITVEEADGFLVITVEDNGAGMDEKKLNHINKMLEDNKSDVKTSIGLRNVNGRIKLYYGSGYGVKLSSKLNQGTKVMVYLPSKGAVSLCSTL